MKQRSFFLTLLGLLLVIILAGYWFVTKSSTSEVSGLSSQQYSNSSSAANTVAGAPDLVTSVQSTLGKNQNEPLANVNKDTNSGANTAPPWAKQPPSDTLGQQKNRISKEERKKIREQIHTKMSALLAKGKNVSLADTQKFLDEIEALGKNEFDTRYFSTMRGIIRETERSQALSNELTKIAPDRSKQADARRSEILKEMRDLSDRVANGSQALQSYAREPLKVVAK